MGRRVPVTNESAFPVTIDSINAYYRQNSELKRVSKALKAGSPLKPGKSRKFELPAATKLFGVKPMIVWFGTQVDAACASCIAEVDTSVREGIAVSPLETLRFEAIPAVFDEFDVYKLLLKIKTPYLSAGGEKISQKEVALTADANVDDTVRIYMPQNAKRPDPLLYKYQIGVVKNDGSEVTGAQWYDGRSLNLFIGSSQVSQVLEGK